MIRLEAVSKHYAAGEMTIRAVDEASLELGDHDFVIMTGPSGSGKTTLLNLIAGLTGPDRGTIEVAGQDILSMTDATLSMFRARTIGFVFQFQSMLPTIDALSNVLLPLRFASVGAPFQARSSGIAGPSPLLQTRDEGPGYALSLLEKVGLAERAHAYSHELSEGEKRRVCIARALINRPALLLCDEPTGDLDPETESIIMEVIADAHDKGATILMATHNRNLLSYATGTILIENGKVISC